MKKLSILLLLLVSLRAQADPIHFFKGTLADAQERAASEGKLIFVDAYTTWCGPCKMMDRNVFSRDEVGDYYNAAFVNLKLDMEAGEGKDFQRKYQVAAFPTLLFLDATGKVVHRKVGAMNPEGFLEMGKKMASTEVVNTTGLEKEYMEGRRDAAFMAEYIKLLAQSDRPLLKVANEYLDTQSELNTPENLTVIYHGLVEVDSRIFNMATRHQKALSKQFGQDALEKQIASAARNTVQKAIEYQNSDLLEEAIDKVKRYAGAHHDRFQHEARMQYYGTLRDAEGYHRAATPYVRLGDAQSKEVIMFAIQHFRNHDPLMKSAETWSLALAKSQPTDENLFMAAQYLYLHSKWADARSYAQQARDLAQKTQPRMVPYVESLIEAIDAKEKS